MVFLILIGEVRRSRIASGVCLMKYFKMGFKIEPRNKEIFYGTDIEDDEGEKR